MSGALQVFAGRDRELALGNLERMKSKGAIKDVTPVLVDKYLKLRKVHHRVTPKMLVGASSSSQHETELKQSFWIAPKHMYPDLNSRINAEFFVPASSLEDFPDQIERDSVWVVDQALPRSSIGPGVLEWSTRLKRSTTAAYDDADPDEATSRQASEESRAGGEVAPAKRPRLDVLQGSPAVETADNDKRSLLRQETCPDESEGSSVGERIARECAEHAKNGRLFNSDVHVYNTVESCVVQYLDYIIPLRERFDQSSSSEQFVATLPDHVSLFMKFVTKCLLNSSTLDGLGQVTQHFQRLDGHVQGLVPPVGLVLVRMAAFNHQSEDTLELKDVPFAKRQVLIESKLWCAFMHKRFMTRLVKVRDAVAVDHAGR